MQKHWKKKNVWRWVGRKRKKSSEKKDVIWISWLKSSWLRDLVIINFAIQSEIWRIIVNVIDFSYKIILLKNNKKKIKQFMAVLYISASRTTNKKFIENNILDATWFFLSIFLLLILLTLCVDNTLIHFNDWLLHYFLYSLKKKEYLSREEKKLFLFTCSAYAVLF
jgi:hypothetical protein